MLIQCPYILRGAVGISICLVLALLPAQVSAQGFNVLNQRNHPELDWRVAETAHFNIVYPAHLKGIEKRAAAVAEASYRVLAANLDTSFTRPLRIYLTDEDEIANGFAMPFGNGYTNIWVNAGQTASIFTGQGGWLRKVVPHELAHLFHFQTVRTHPQALNFLLGHPVPRFWTEGLAQYQTEPWDAYRGEQWLRVAVFQDELSYRDQRSLWNGRLMYAVGNSQVRFFAEQYSDSTLVKLLHHRRSALLGLVEVHDFHEAFQAVTDDSYETFYDRWREHVNIYYNTIAGQVERVDSLAGKPLEWPGQYLYDAAYSPDTSKIAVVALKSLERPVPELLVFDNDSTPDPQVLAEGALQPPVAWHPTGSQLAYVRRTRGRHGSLINDLYMVNVDGSNRRRLTHSRRAALPTFSPSGNRLAFVDTDNGTSNVVVRTLTGQEERQLTDFAPGTRLVSLAWHPSRDSLAAAVFSPEKGRRLVLIDVASQTVKTLLADGYDNRDPVWAPNGQRLAFTSLRDEVPNVFVLKVDGTEDPQVQRVTHLFTGASVMDWAPSDSTAPEGRLVLRARKEKTRDVVYRVKAGRRVELPPVKVPASYRHWTHQQPPETVSNSPEVGEGLITGRRPYRSWKNLTHVGTLGAPYYLGTERWGLAGFTNWVEPLGKHGLLGAGFLNGSQPLKKSSFLVQYLNNQWAPTLLFNGYQLPGAARFYGEGLLVERLTGADVRLRWPLDWLARPYEQLTAHGRLRAAQVTPLNAEEIARPPVLPSPERVLQTDLRLGLTYRIRRPYRYNLIHPLDGAGISLQLTGAFPAFDRQSRFVQPDVAAYHIFPLSVGRLFVYGRAQARFGQGPPQNYIGLAKYDPIRVPLPGVGPLQVTGAERVRGYRRYALGNRLLFGSLEYRLLLPLDLQTSLLGAVSFGRTALALFVDGGVVWEGGDHPLGRSGGQQLGVGMELKNIVSLGPVKFGHALGVAHPQNLPLKQTNLDLYYRIQTAVPF